MVGVACDVAVLAVPEGTTSAGSALTLVLALSLALALPTLPIKAPGVITRRQPTTQMGSAQPWLVCGPKPLWLEVRRLRT